MAGVQRQVSLLLSHGHSQAWFYPLGMVSDEAETVIERLNSQEATRSSLISAAFAATQSKKGSAAFKKAIKELIGE